MGDHTGAAGREPRRTFRRASRRAPGPLLALVHLLGAAAVFGLLLGGAGTVMLFAFTDWFDPIARYCHEYRPWGHRR
ncbi:hypothetical protein [Streptomyces sp. CB03911]|uniref:hypothetical protein n=1 Tax=Streptomyces sp. CB03911 TaxID=1804758 RepID=UPI0018FEC84C|nr:hypothetical protein [Streptomyces sp. CB03911]